MQIFAWLSIVVWYAVVTLIVAVLVLMLLRALINRVDMNPFGWLPLTVRRWSDPLVNPVRRGLARAGLDPKYAPLVAALIAILLGYFGLQLFGTVLFTINGLILSTMAGAPVRVLGFVIFGVLAIYMLLIFMRIVFAWGMSSESRVMRFLVRVTEPVLLPFRRLIPPVGMFDISPIIVLFLLDLLQRAVAGTLLAG
ncbi:MAG: YggT family protein [Pyrinomonadaceae bacterium]